MRYPLVDGQGNFGSIDGDPPAAMRYTEARLQGARRRHDGGSRQRRPSTSRRTTTRPPKSRPSCRRRSRICCVNGSAGIAVGMATNVPPHNLREVIDGCIWLIENTHLKRTTTRSSARNDKIQAAASA